MPSLLEEIAFLKQQNSLPSLIHSLFVFMVFATMELVFFLEQSAQEAFPLLRARPLPFGTKPHTLQTERVKFLRSPRVCQIVFIMQSSLTWCCLVHSSKPLAKCFPSSRIQAYCRSKIENSCTRRPPNSKGEMIASLGSDARDIKNINGSSPFWKITFHNNTSIKILTYAHTHKSAARPIYFYGRQHPVFISWCLHSIKLLNRSVFWLWAYVGEWHIARQALMGATGRAFQNHFLTTQQSHVWNAEAGAQLWKRLRWEKKKTKQTDWLHDRWSVWNIREIFSHEKRLEESELSHPNLHLFLYLAPLQWANTALERWERASRGHRVNRQLWVLRAAIATA